MSFECKILPDEDLESLSQSQASRNDSDFIPSNSSPPDSSGSTSGPESSQVIRGGVFLEEKKRPKTLYKGLGVAIRRRGCGM